MTAIIGEYIQLQTYKEKPYVTLHIDFPEEMADEIIKAIGWKKSGESIYLGVTLMNRSALGDYLNSKQAMVPIEDEQTANPVSKESLPANPDIGITTTEKSEGDKLRGRAFCLCEEDKLGGFQEYVMRIQPNLNRYNDLKVAARNYIYSYCNITSRSELTDSPKARAKFRELDENYKAWQDGNKYKDNLDRE